MTADGRDWKAIERWLVVLIALHSAGVGTILTFFPGFAGRLAGWGEITPDFFLRQGGVLRVPKGTCHLVSDHPDCRAREGAGARQCIQEAAWRFGDAELLTICRGYEYTPTSPIT